MAAGQSAPGRLAQGLFRSLVERETGLLRELRALARRIAPGAQLRYALLTVRAFKFGAGDRVRTGDLLVGNETL